MKKLKRNLVLESQVRGMTFGTELTEGICGLLITQDLVVVGHFCFQLHWLVRSVEQGTSFCGIAPKINSKKRQVELEAISVHFAILLLIE